MEDIELLLLFKSLQTNPESMMWSPPRRRLSVNPFSQELCDSASPSHLTKYSWLSELPRLSARKLSTLSGMKPRSSCSLEFYTNI